MKITLQRAVFHCAKALCQLTGLWQHRRSSWTCVVDTHIRNSIILTDYIHCIEYNFSSALNLLILWSLIQEFFDFQLTSHHPPGRLWAIQSERKTWRKISLCDRTRTETDKHTRTVNLESPVNLCVHRTDTGDTAKIHTDRTRRDLNQSGSTTPPCHPNTFWVSVLFKPKPVANPKESY